MRVFLLLLVMEATAAATTLVVIMVSYCSVPLFKGFLTKWFLFSWLSWLLFPFFFSFCCHSVFWFGECMLVTTWFCFIFCCCCCYRCCQRHYCSVWAFNCLFNVWHEVWARSDIISLSTIQKGIRTHSIREKKTIFFLIRCVKNGRMYVSMSLSRSLCVFVHSIVIYNSLKWGQNFFNFLMNAWDMISIEMAEYRK